MATFYLNGNNLSLEILEKISRCEMSVALNPRAERRMNQSVALLRQWLQKGETIYGINTGFGALSDRRVADKDLEKLQTNIIRSHSAGVGPCMENEEARVVTLLRAQVLAQGCSGVRPLIVKNLLQLLNREVTPRIPQKGSVGASGDLAPLAHLALCLIGEGEATYKSAPLTGKAVTRKARIKPVRLQLREGLALVNGTQGMAAVAALNILKAERLLRLFDIATGLSLEAIQGSRKAFDADIHQLRPHDGQRLVAKNIWKLVQKSNIQSSHKFCGKIQDSYSFRCAPQVHGTSRDAWAYAKRIVETELNSVTDNPILIPSKKKWISGGNFHGQYLSQAMDFLSIAMATMVNISERRIEKLLDPKFSGHPPFLIKDSGLCSGLMAPHYTAAALASENKVLSHPASVDTIPTSGNKEDHVSMGIHAVFKAKNILKNAEDVVSIELLTASQGIELLRPLKSSPHLEKVMKILRKKVAPIKTDRVFAKDMSAIKGLHGSILSSLKGIVA